MEIPASVGSELRPGPAKAEQLRRSLVVVPRTITRPLTADEFAFQQVPEPVEEEGAYQSSVLWAPEYEIKPDGGRRGPMYMADLLRAPNGDYLVPKSPALIAGMEFAVLLEPPPGPGRLGGDFVVRVPAWPPRQATSSCTATRTAPSRSARSRQRSLASFICSQARCGRRLALRWRLSCPTACPSLALSRSGRDGKTLLEGGVRALVAQQNQSRLIDAAADVHFYWDAEFEFGGAKLVKVWVDADLDVEAKFAEYVDASLSAQLAAHVAVGEFQKKEVMFTVEVCFESHCARTSVTVEVPDLSSMTWGTPFGSTVELEAEASSNPTNPLFDCTLSGSIPIPGAEAFPISVSLPTLMPNLV